MLEPSSQSQGLEGPAHCLCFVSFAATIGRRVPFRSICKQMFRYSNHWRALWGSAGLRSMASVSTDKHQVTTYSCKAICLVSFLPTVKQSFDISYPAICITAKTPLLRFWSEFEDLSEVGSILSAKHGPLSTTSANLDPGIHFIPISVQLIPPQF